MPDTKLDLSAMAELLVRRMMKEPDRERYDIDVFTGLFRERDIVRLDEAYAELERAGLIERTGRIVRFFQAPKRIYRLSPLGRTLVELSS